MYVCTHLNISYPDKERDLDLERERETDLAGDLAGDRCEDLPLGDLLYDRQKFYLGKKNKMKSLQKES